MVAVLGRLGDQVKALHVKDGDGTLDNKAQVAVGDGTIAVTGILKASPDTLRVVELDDYESEIFDAVAGSFTYLTGADVA